MATRLEDYELLSEKPPQRQRYIQTEPELARALVAKKEKTEWRGINIKEVFLLVKEPGGPIVGKALFKPGIGEQDWPKASYGIPWKQQYIREAVADTLDELFGWNVVPPTDIRIVNFRGIDQIGSLQQWMSKEVQDERKDENDIYRMALLDVVLMNRDRHSGNMLYVDGDLWAIDNGLSMGSLPGLRNEGWSGYSGRPIPQKVLQDFRSVEEGDLRAALAPLNDKWTVEEAVARWKWAKKFDVLPNSAELTEFMFRWMLDNLPKKELEERKKAIMRQYNEGGSYRRLIDVFGDKVFPEGYCQECRGEHVGSATRHEREKREAQERRNREAEKWRKVQEQFEKQRREAEERERPERERRRREAEERERKAEEDAKARGMLTCTICGKHHKPPGAVLVK